MNKSGFKDTKNYAHYEKGVRESMAKLPWWTQYFLTWLTGHALDGQRPVIRLSPVIRLLFVIVQCGLTFASVTYVFESSPEYLWLVLPVYWILMTGGLRSLQLVYGHHAVHNALSKNKLINNVCAIACTTIPLVMNENDYRHTHISHHKFKTFCTSDDDDSKFLMQLGFRPGLSRRQLWMRFLLAPINPVFHWRFLVGRFRSNFTASSVSQTKRLCNLIWFGAISIYSLIYGLQAFLLLILIPMFFLYNFSALINFMTEHSWMNEDGAVRSQEQYNSKCWGRFCGQRYPIQGRWWNKVGWWTLMLFYHLPVRLFALVGDVTVHDVHHLYSYPKNRFEWVYDIYRRQFLLANDPHGMADRELWGLYKTIDSVFVGMSRQ